jgi:hypothetical protein
LVSVSYKTEDLFGRGVYTIPVWSFVQVKDPFEKVFTLLRPLLAPDQGFVPLNTPLTFRIDYYVTNPFSSPMTNIRLQDSLAPNLALNFTAFAANPGRPIPTMPSLAPGQSVNASIQAYTTQSFTTAGLKRLDNGSNVTWTMNGQSQNFSSTPAYVVAGNSVGGIVGIVYSGIQGVKGATVNLYRCNDQSTYCLPPPDNSYLYATTTTGKSGFYEFDSVQPGFYVLSVTTNTSTGTQRLIMFAGTAEQINLYT